MQLTIKNKLRIAFVSLAIFFIAFSLLTINRMNVINAQSTEMEENWIPSIVATNAINTATGDLRIAEALHVLSTDDAEMAHFEKVMEDVKQTIANWRAKYEPLISSPEETAKYKEFSRKYDQYLTLSKDAMTLSRKNDNVKAALKVKESGKIYDHLSADLVDLVEINKTGAIQASRTGDIVFSTSQYMIFAASIIVVLMTIILMWRFEVLISVPLEQITGIIQKLAKGDVAVAKIFQERNDEIGQAAQAVSSIIDTLKRLTSDALQLINAAQSGALATRIDANRHPGEFGEIIRGMNQLLESLTKPLNEVAEVMQHLALGNLQGRMQGAYEGDLRALRANVNRSLDALVNLLQKTYLNVRNW